MKAILGDANFEGQTEVLVQLLERDPWQEFWRALALDVLTFAALGLPGSTPDDELWRLCQREGIVLLTDNRNRDGPKSLEAAIRAETTPTSLPVFTVAASRRIMRNRGYAARVAERLLDYLYRIDEVRGTGRIYLP